MGEAMTEEITSAFVAWSRRWQPILMAFASGVNLTAFFEAMRDNSPLWSMHLLITTVTLAVAIFVRRQ